MATTPKPFDKMIKSELEEAATFLKLTDAVVSIAKDPQKITNAEYVQVLEAFKDKQASENPEITREVTRKVTKSAQVDPKATAEEVKATMIEDFSTGIPVIVTDHDTSVSVQEDVVGRTVAIRWGNPVIGMSTTNVPLHGRMQYLPKGCIIRMRKVPLADHIKDSDGKETSNRDRKRFSVADTTGWTEDEFNSHKEEQKLKRIERIYSPFSRVVIYD